MPGSYKESLIMEALIPHGMGRVLDHLRDLHARGERKHLDEALEILYHHHLALSPEARAALIPAPCSATAVSEGNCSVGIVGLAVMGANLALNFAGHGFSVAVYNRTWAATKHFMDENGEKAGIIPADTPAALVAALAAPRRIILMVKADAVDAVLDEFAPFLAPGDTLIDGGNSHFRDTERRCRKLASFGVAWVGCGISGGAEGALHGPAIMAGGDAVTLDALRGLLPPIAARAADGAPCCVWTGHGGSGHYVKMVHNGIEYADMQLIAEAYWMLRHAGRGNEECARFFEQQKTGKLAGYLVDITTQILRYTDPATGTFLVDSIRDTAQSKGTGRWTVESALELGVPVPTLAAALMARQASDETELRWKIAESPPELPTPDTLEKDMTDALYAGKIAAYAQGFALLRAASETYAWRLDGMAIASAWRGGCIIRAALLEPIRAAFAADPAIEHLLDVPFFREELASALPGFRRLAAYAAASGAPVPALGSALTYLDTMRCSALPTNLVQAQRDFFGAHTFERIDQPRGMFFHADWPK